MDYLIILTVEDTLIRILCLSYGQINCFTHIKPREIGLCNAFCLGTVVVIAQSI